MLESRLVVRSFVIRRGGLFNGIIAKRLRTTGVDVDGAPVHTRDRDARRNAVDFTDRCRRRGRFLECGVAALDVVMGRVRRFIVGEGITGQRLRGAAPELSWSHKGSGRFVKKCSNVTLRPVDFGAF